MTIRISLLALGLALTPVLANAHSTARTGVPADGATLAAAPETLRLEFTGPMRITVLKLVGPGGEVPVARTDGMKPVTTLEATPDGAMIPGDYRIEWRGMGADGHIMEGSTRFTLRP